MHTTPIHIATQEYQYTPLTKPTNFRLLQIMPGRHGSDIHFSLQEIEENPDEEYHAISYVWGPPGFNDSIFSENGYLKITDSLFAALQRYRSPNKSVTVWADAVCINQKDLQERAQQVVIMASIYSKSAQVFIWLGEEQDFDHGVVKMIQDVVQQASHSEKEGLFDPAISLKIKDEFMSASRSEARKGLTYFLENPWFMRTWTYQEFVCAARAELSLGSLKLDCESLTSFVLFLFSQGLYAVLFTSSARKSFQQFLAASITRTQRISGTGKFSFLEVVSSSRNRRCMDPRDKIYGLLGATTDPEALPYLPDYAISVDKQYCDFAAHQVKRSNNLGLFQYCLFSENELPTWTPDWRIDVMSSSIRLPEFQASAVLPLLSPLSVQGNVMTVGGIALDTIGAIQTNKLMIATSIVSTDREKMKALLHSQSLVVEETIEMVSSSPRYQSDDLWWEPWWRTVIGDCLQGAIRATPDAQQSVQTYRKGLTKLAQDFDDDDDRPGEADMRTFMLVENRVLAMASFRSFCRTRDGRVGWVPEAAQEGDSISILAGSDTPILLRPKGDSHLMVGECYIHGLMNGEDLMGTDLPPIQQIKLV